MSEPTIRCPSCQTEIKLTESLAAPILASARREFDQKLAQKDTEVAKREATLRSREADLAKAQAGIDDEVSNRLKSERLAIAAAEAKRARDALADEISKAQQEKAAVDQLLKERDTKLAEARQNELTLRQDRQRLQDERDRFELDKQKAIEEERTKIREAARRDADDQSRFKLAEKDKTIASLQEKLQDALRKAEQGSQQLQGEVQELALEQLLREKFPRDTIEPVAKGEHGGDVLQKVFRPTGQLCGTILWESKRTKSWNDGWLTKLRDDMRSAHAEVCIVVSQVLPKDVETFTLIDGVWVTSFKCAVPVATALRHSLVELAAAKMAGEGQQTKMEMVYQYLTGPRFRHRVQAIVEKFGEMQEDLDRERKSQTRLWAKREEQIREVIESTAGMYGDLQGIAGKSLREIEGLDHAPLLDGQSRITHKE